MYKEKILIVEDEMIVGKDIEYTIENLGYVSCGLVSQWNQAIESVKNTSPTLILMDIMIGEDKDGIELGKYIWENYKIPIVFVSAYTDKTTIKRAKRANPFGYLRKPFDEKELYLAIEIARYKNKKFHKERTEKEWIELTIGVIEHGIITINNKREIVFHNNAIQNLTGLLSRDLRDELIENIFEFDVDIDNFSDKNIEELNGTVIFNKECKNCEFNYSFKPIKHKYKMGGVFTFFTI